MSNSRDKLVLRLAIVTILLMISCVMVAVGTNPEQLAAKWTGSGIEATAWNFSQNENYYQFRYYQPGTPTEGFGENVQLWSDEAKESENYGKTGPYNSSTNPTGFYIASPKWPGNNTVWSESSPKTEVFIDPEGGWTPGVWTVALMQNGTTKNKNNLDLLANSLKIHVPVEIPIPEFPTIALPIAGIIGIMFVLQNRNRKED
ncbi:MAG: PEF-CTERM sorting domain-containing protein [ANME-2 cluster archaeon]|nr:PEF-CTERM sorting domain-containing protein [ANME-2 cluster archaeon]